MTVIDEAVALAEPLAKQAEGFRSTPYLGETDGVWTVGYGTTWLPDGSPVTADTRPLTEEQAAALLRVGLRVAAASALKLSPVLVGFTGALAAITDFIYNLGSGRYRASTLRRRVGAQDWLGVREELLRWVRAGGKVRLGLVTRRKAGAALV